MKDLDLVRYIVKKKSTLSDVLWKQGRVFTLHDENQNPIEIEEYGSYVDYHKNIKGTDVDNGAYDDYDTNIDDECGTRPKLFFRVQSDFFKSLIEEKKNNPNCSYVTCVDELLNEGYVPEKISAIVKQLYIDRSIVENAEMVSSQILNFFEVPTISCSNLTLQMPHRLNQKFVVSADFLKPNEIMFNLNQYMEQYVYKIHSVVENIKTTEDLVNLYKKIFDAHYNKVAEAGFEIPDEKTLNQKFESWKDQICYMTLVRKYAMGDSDFTTKNLGVIINTKTNDINIAPAFDLELHGSQDIVFGSDFLERYLEAKDKGSGIKKCAYDYAFRSYGMRTFIRDIGYINQNCPQVIEKFLGKSNELIDEKDNESKLNVFLNELTEGVLDISDYKPNYKTGLTFVRDFCKDLVNESLAEFDM